MAHFGLSEWCLLRVPLMWILVTKSTIIHFYLHPELYKSIVRQIEFSNIFLKHNKLKKTSIWSSTLIIILLQKTHSTLKLSVINGFSLVSVRQNDITWKFSRSLLNSAEVYTLSAMILEIDFSTLSIHSAILVWRIS